MLTVSERLRQNQPTVSRHLAKMKFMMIVTSRREGNCIYYSLNEKSRSGELVKYIMLTFSDIPAFEQDWERMGQRELSLNQAVEDKRE